jgi:biofilm PGA synthesis N-glycosyltransferase PgaC
VKDGKIDYVSGYLPLFLTVKSLVRLLRRPYLIGSFALAYGYISAHLAGMPRVNDPELIRYLRRQQLAKLFGGQTIWK